MKVLIFGSQGFIGSYLSVGMNTIPFYSRSSKYDLLRTLHLEQPTHLVFCAGQSSIAQSYQNRNERLQDVLLLEMVLSSIQESKLKMTVVFISSQAVYREQSKAIKETDPIDPISPYALNKFNSERVLKESGVPYVILRVFSCYGNGQRKQILWDAVKQTTPELIFNGSNSVRDFIHVIDLKSAVTTIIDTNCQNEIFNVGSGNPIKISTAVKYLGLNKPVRFKNEHQAGNIKEIFADISKISSLGWKPNVEIKTGIRDYATWSRNVFHPHLDCLSP